MVPRAGVPMAECEWAACMCAGVSLHFDTTRILHNGKAGSRCQTGRPEEHSSLKGTVMAIGTIGQVTAGMLAGVLLVGVPGSAIAGEKADAPSSDPDCSQAMASAEHRMGKQMSRMMKDEDMRREMVSMMSEMGGDMAGADMPHMG